MSKAKLPTSYSDLDGFEKQVSDWLLNEAIVMSGIQLINGSDDPESPEAIAEYESKRREAIVAQVKHQYGFDPTDKQQVLQSYRDGVSKYFYFALKPVFFTQSNKVNSGVKYLRVFVKSEISESPTVLSYLDGSLK